MRPIERLRTVALSCLCGPAINWQLVQGEAPLWLEDGRERPPQTHATLSAGEVGTQDEWMNKKSDWEMLILMKRLLILPTCLHVPFLSNWLRKSVSVSLCLPVFQSPSLCLYLSAWLTPVIWSRRLVEAHRDFTPCCSLTRTHTHAHSVTVCLTACLSVTMINHDIKESLWDFLPAASLLGGWWQDVKTLALLLLTDRLLFTLFIFYFLKWRKGGAI